MAYKFEKISGGGSSVEIVQTTGRSEKAVMSQKATSQTFANALKGSESGSVIALKDVSPIEHIIGVKVSSKNIADDTEITIKSLGKNVLTPISGYDSFVYYGNPFTTAGITYTLLEDGRIHLQGTVTAYSMCYFFGTYVPFDDFLIDGATYSVSVNIEGNAGSTFQFMGEIADKTTGSTTSYIANHNNKFTVDKSKYTYKMFRIQTTNVGDVVDAIVGVQLEIGDTATEYEPYKEYETIITTVGDSAELTSVAPNMTITTDNEGAIIECSYNKDTNKVIEKLTQAIISLGGNV